MLRYCTRVVGNHLRGKSTNHTQTITQLNRDYSDGIYKNSAPLEEPEVIG